MVPFAMQSQGAKRAVWSLACRIMTSDLMYTEIVAQLEWECSAVAEWLPLTHAELEQLNTRECTVCSASLFSRLGD
jgi:hypothetical protein